MQAVTLKIKWPGESKGKRECSNTTHTYYWHSLSHKLGILYILCVRGMEARCNDSPGRVVCPCQSPHSVQQWLRYSTPPWCPPSWSSTCQRKLVLPLSKDRQRRLAEGDLPLLHCEGTLPRTVRSLSCSSLLSAVSLMLSRPR